MRFLVLILLASIASAQSFEFKGLKLGISRDAVTKTIDKKVWFAQSRAFHKANKFEVNLPLCSDDRWKSDSVIISATQYANEVSCTVSTVDVNPEFGRIAGQPGELRIGFIEGKLWRMDGAFFSSAFPEIKKAFIAKFGEPSSTETESFQNGYGAKWDGAVLTWKNKHEALVLREGSANGPVSWLEAFKFMRGSFNLVDLDVFAKVEKKPTVDF